MFFAGKMQFFEKNVKKVEEKFAGIKKMPTFAIPIERKGSSNKSLVP